MKGRYQPVPRESGGALLSRTTGLRLKPEGHRLRLVDPATGDPLLSDEEVREELLRLRRELGRRET